MDVLLLSYRGEALREFGLHDRPLEVGRGAGCDIVVHDPAVRERHLLVSSRGGAVLVHELDGQRRPAVPFATGSTLTLGRNHTLARLPVVPTRPHDLRQRTEPVERGRARELDLSLIVGRGSDARRVTLEARPLTVGSGELAGLKLHDRTVSGVHCRFELGRDGLRLRDLGSRNGTHVDGVSINLARVDAGSTIRVGRTDLRLVARGRSGDARSAGLIAESAAMREVLAHVERFAALPWPTLITGESGSGKEGVARALHDRGRGGSGDSDAPFVAINAGGMPASLVESELFGHERGAFTGAAGVHRGVFEQAHGGTLFLDEIGELPQELQARLLRVLETWEIRRVGSEAPIAVDVRLVCATHRDLRAMVAAGTFRQDLYYRVAQLGVHVPALRDRTGEIEPLVDHFLAQVAEQVGPKRFTEAALARLGVHDWPGNVRELRNVVRRVAARCPSSEITRADVVAVLVSFGAPREIDGRALEELVRSHDGNLAAAARTLGIARTTLRDRLRKRRA